MSSNLASAMLNLKIRPRLWDTALKFFIPVLRITSPDHLKVRVKWRLGFVRVPVIFSPKFSNSHQNAFPSLSQTLHYQPRVLELPILFPQAPERIVILCILPLFTCLRLRVGHFELCVRDKVCDRPTLNFLHRQILRINVQSAACLSDFKGVCNCSEHKASKTRQHNNRAS